jgi:hypothetical protein
MTTISETMDVMMAGEVEARTTYTGHRLLKLAQAVRDMLEAGAIVPNSGLLARVDQELAAATQELGGSLADELPKPAVTPIDPADEIDF